MFKWFLGESKSCEGPEPLCDDGVEGDIHG